MSLLSGLSSPELTLLLPSNRFLLQIVEKLSKAFSAADREHKAALAVAAPLEEALAEVMGKMESIVGTAKLGSQLELDDVDALTRRDREQVCVLRAASLDALVHCPTACN